MNDKYQPATTVSMSQSVGVQDKSASIQTLGQLQSTLESVEPEQRKELISAHTEIIASLPTDQFIAFFSKYSGNRVMMESLRDAYFKGVKELALDDLKRIKEAYVSGFKSVDPSEKEGYLHRFMGQLLNNKHITTAEAAMWALPIVPAPAMKQRIWGEFIRSSKSTADNIAIVGGAFVSNKEELAIFARTIYDKFYRQQRLVNPLLLIQYRMENSELSKGLIDEWLKLGLNKEVWDKRKATLDIAKDGLILGLSGKDFEGGHPNIANAWTKERFSTLASEQERLPFHTVDSYQETEALSRPIKQHGDLQGVHAF